MQISIWSSRDITDVFMNMKVKLVALHGEEDKWSKTTMLKSLNWVVISSEKNWRLQLHVSISMFWSSSGECRTLEDAAV